MEKYLKNFIKICSSFYIFNIFEIFLFLQTKIPPPNVVGVSTAPVLYNATSPNDPVSLFL